MNDREASSFFDALVEARTGYPNIDGVLKDLRDHRADLPRALERPELPLHNNAMESNGHLLAQIPRRSPAMPCRSLVGSPGTELEFAL